MAIPTNFALESYAFDLPEGHIAQEPSLERTSSRLLVVERFAPPTDMAVCGKGSGSSADPCSSDGNPVVFEGQFADLVSQLPEGCLLVANNSRVIPARVYGTRKSGGRVEFLLLTPLPLLEVAQAPATLHEQDRSIADQPWQMARAECLLRSSKQVKIGEQVHFSGAFFLELRERGEFGRCQVVLHWQGELAAHLQTLGSMPLPPYIRRGESDSASGIWGNDGERYQTTYSREDKAGSVAAPTAGLHFTPELRQALEASGRIWAEVTLYVGYGTFSPVRASDVRDHAMHAEYAEIPEATVLAINKARAEGRAIIAVGTTSVRTLEGMYRHLHPEVFLPEQSTDAATHPENDPLFPLGNHAAWLNLFLYPGETFYVIDGLVTNFHLPGSSLLMLVSALAGRQRILNAYAHAIAENYRFFSYGDAMLIR